jgi:hypothetical protein
LQSNLFRDGNLQRHALLAVVFLLLCTVTAATASDRRLRWLVAGGMVLAVVGLGLACWSKYAPDSAALVLRFYWFRMSDCLTPLGVALVGLQFLLQLRATKTIAARWWLVGLLLISANDFALQLRHVPGLSTLPEATIPRADKNVVYEDWRKACDWAAENTPTGSVFITPRASYTFKWYTRRPGVADSGRGETANWKDMPQDGKHIVEWWQRLQEVFGTGNLNPKLRWYESLAEGGAEHLRAMAEKYGAQYAIVEKLPGVPALPIAPVYENDSYAIYEFALKN